jgi:hypothetical protein
MDGTHSVEYEIVTDIDTDRVGAPLMVRMLVNRARHDLICFVGDDTIPQPGFLEHAVEDMASLPDGWGLVGLNDLTGRTLACHWLAHRNLLDEIGGEFFHTGYRHCFCDNELMERAIMLGRFVYSQKSIVKHDHPILNGIPVTGDYARVYRRDNYIHDQILFQQRRKQWLNA